MTLTNRIAKSSLVTINLENYYPAQTLLNFDLKDYLWKELILKEKDFRAALNDFDWSGLTDKYLNITCSTDAIIPLWAYMLIAVKAAPFVKGIFEGDKDNAISQIIISEVKADFPAERIQDGKFVIKGCSKYQIQATVYASISAHLQAHARSIMFGEPCSTVPIYKAPRKKQ